MNGHGTILAGGGEMGALMRSFDWSKTPVGPVEAWPQSLRTAVSILLDSRFPMYISWGPEFVQFYNDGYRPVLGTKHPDALGRSTYETWSEVWDDIVGPLFRKVKAEEEPTYLEDFLFPLFRYGYTEECYFTFCYSPIREESGEAGGVLATCIETTARMVGERRLRTLRELAARANEARTVTDSCRSAISVLASNPHDLPFAAIYLVDADHTVRLAGSCGLSEGHPATPVTMSLARVDAVWPVAELTATGGMRVVDDLKERFESLPGGPWPEKPSHAAVVPVPREGQEGIAAILIAGISPRRAFDDDYRGFLDLIAGHLARAIANARAYQTEQKRAEALAELDRAKTVFFSNVSHEFRTPLTLFLGQTEDVLADRKGTLDAAYREQLTVAHRNALRLLRLVNMLLDYSRIESGRMEPFYEPADLCAFTTELASGFRSAAERAGLRLVVDCEELNEPAYVDRAMWEKIVLNLLSNALKHTFEGEITVALRRVRNQAQLTVRDTGVGIPAEHLPKIFDRFHRVSGARARTHEGSGIGLALVEQLVHLHGGSVQVMSRENHGSTFTVRIPFGYAHLPADRIGVERPSSASSAAVKPYVEEALQWGREDSNLGAPEPGDGATPETRGARILLAEDNADLRSYVTRLLTERGWQVDAVRDGAAALKRALEAPPDLVITDVMMPGTDGLALVQSLRANPSTRTVPIVILSARAGEESRVEGLEVGADDYLVKPFTAQELVARIKTHLAMAKLRREAEAEKTRLLKESTDAKAALEVKAAELQQNAIELEAQSEELIAATNQLENMNRRLSVSETRLRLANMAAGIGTWQLDVTTGEFVCDDQCRRVLRLTAEKLTYNDLVAAAREDDRKRLRELLEQARVKPAAPGKEFSDFSLEFRVPATDDERWVALTGRSFYSTDEGQRRGPVRVVGTVHDSTNRRRAEDALRDEAQIIETVQRVGSALASELDLSSLVQTVTDEATKLTSAQFGAFFYNVLNENGESYMLYTISGVPRETFSSLPMPRNTKLFEPTFRGTGIVRSADIRKDPRYGQQAPYFGMPEGHLPVVSYLAVPVISRSGEVLGGLFFGHSDAGVFTEQHERLVAGVAGWAAVAIDNARLYERERRARRDAEVARREAEQANKAKTEFLATMSHELRTPLNAISGYVDLLDLEIRGPITAQQRADLRRIQRSQQHLLSLINDVLNFAKLEAGQVEFHSTVVPFAELVADIEQLVAPQMAAKNLTYSCVGCDADFIVRADEEKTRQIILNFLTNALKFTDPGGGITLRCQERDEVVAISVADTGRGIPADKLERIFEPFVQIDRHLTPSAHQGVGLGLAISRDLARAMNGDIEVQSEVGVGTTFTLTLPKA